MIIALDDNPTRQKIIMLIKKNGRMSVAELSRHMGITHMAVRQHLLFLEKKGVIRFEPKKYGIGRPIFYYMLTEKANTLFPNKYGKFIYDVFRSIEKTEGRDKLDRIFRLRKDMLVEAVREGMGEEASPVDRASMLASMLDEDGAMVETERKEGVFVLKQYNCVLSEIATRFPEACKYELEFFKDLFGDSVKRCASKLSGDQSCSYEIPI